MIKITVDYSESINHYPSYKRITTKFYIFGARLFTRIQTSDASYIAKTYSDRRR